VSHLKRSLVVSRQPDRGRTRDTVEVITEERVERYRRVLGLGPAAGVDDVRRCYRREMRRWHPDLSGGDAERAKLINEARDYFTKHPATIPVKPAAKARTAQPRTPPAPRWTPPTAPASSRPAAAPTAGPPHRTQAPPTPRRSSPAQAVPSRVAPVPQPATARRVADGVATVLVYGWVAVTGVVQLLGLLLIVCLVIYVVALLWLLLATVIPWFLRVVVPMAGWG
jgi:hypothetical protein